MTVTTNVARDTKPYIIPGTEMENDCITQVDIYIPVPPGETRYVEIISEGLFVTPATTFTIPSDTIINIHMEGKYDNYNSEISLVALRVKLNSSTAAYYSKMLRRRHSSSTC